jgi:hypothetical protein
VTQLSMLLTVACMTGTVAVAASSSSKRPVPTPPATRAQLASPKPPLVQAAADITWLGGFGSYNVRQGSLNLFQNPTGC